MYLLEAFACSEGSHHHLHITQGDRGPVRLFLIPAGKQRKSLFLPVQLLTCCPDFSMLWVSHQQRGAQSQPLDSVEVPEAPCF
jgi:hypothetical protein